MNTIEKIRQENLKTDVLPMNVGDTVQVNVKIVEGGKERIQAFTGTIIAKNGTGISQTVTLRRVVSGQGVERVIPLHSPRIAGFKMVREGRVRRAKLYYLRDQVGKAARVKAKRLS
ncbi:MAG: 50S ribosomal protein L19 [Oligosphaeraceae bacterium]|nr:50S ribosomal protein L19 [Oligosphaeraceae bacterium]